MKRILPGGTRNRWIIREQEFLYRKVFFLINLQFYLLYNKINRGFQPLNRVITSHWSLLTNHKFNRRRRHLSYRMDEVEAVVAARAAKTEPEVAPARLEAPEVASDSVWHAALEGGVAFLVLFQGENLGSTNAHHGVLKLGHRRVSRVL